MAKPSVRLMLLFLGVGTMASFALLHASARSEETPKVEIQPLSEQVDTSEFQGPQYNIHPAPTREISSMPPPQARDSAFERAGISGPVSGWDEVARDLLFLRARTWPQKRLATEYPKLNSEALETLRKLTRSETKD